MGEWVAFMKMTDSERLTLIRLHEILCLLKPKEAKEHEAAIHVLREGYHEDLYEQTTGTYLADPFPEKDQGLIYDVLDLYESLMQSYSKLSKVERKQVDKNSLRFRGFDEATEHGHLRFVRFVIKKQHRWTGLDHKTDFNAGQPMLEIYRLLLRESRKLKAEPGEYSAEQINKLLAWAQPASDSQQP